ncbi:membrane protein [Intrasporangium oryzae NRRL B-24470]|uniref:Membrane protein n=1 Tax=Intrasporangium oryzae NRRL B-24470 TaxID=1386089 RepID=W9GCD8_9MICO|nr:membrane protein [Intrasporangium oryzae]EWT02483.1 membrane protein [Intrasporangium oryzae NRRL B-24470]
MKTYRELFSVGAFRVLFLVQCLNVGAYAVSSLALGTITFAATGSAIPTALSMFGAPLVRILGQSWFGSGSDLVRPRRALILIALASLGANVLQAIPDLLWGWRFALLALPPLITSALGGSLIALMSDVLPTEAFILGRATMNIAVGVMQVVGFGVAGLLQLHVPTSQLFLGAAGGLALAALLVRLGLGDHPPRAAGASLVRRTREVNRRLLGSPVIRPVFLSLWVPNGLIVGCEALFVPYAGSRAGYLFAASAAGMLTGDVVVGRFVPAALRDRLIEPLRLLLAVPYLAFFLVPSVPAAAGLAFVASVGYCASLPLQERLVERTEGDVRGQVFGLNGTGLMVGQAFGALLGGVVAQLLTHQTGGGEAARVGSAAQAMALMALASVAATLALTPGLRRSRVRAAEAAGIPT